MFDIAKGFLAKYIIEILIGVIVALSFLSLGLYFKWSVTSGKLDTAIAEKKAVEADREKYKNRFDETTAKNALMAASVDRQNKELETRKAEAEAKDKEIAELQKLARQQAQPHLAQSQAIRTIKLGDDECDNLRNIIDSGIKP